MIRFILKNEQNEYRTIAVNSAELEKLLQRNFEIVGQERMEEFYAKINASTITANKIRAYEEPQFPEKYTPVITRDENDEMWRPRLFLQVRESQKFVFETSQMNYHQMAILAGNENLIHTCDAPKIYWISDNGKPKLIKS